MVVIAVEVELWLMVSIGNWQMYQVLVYTVPGIRVNLLLTVKIGKTEFLQ